MTLRQSPETYEQALQRLAQKARNLEVRILEYPPTNEVYSTSYSQPEQLHRLTAFSCDCPGFMHRGRCMHHALFLWRRGELAPETGEHQIEQAA